MTIKIVRMTERSMFSPNKPNQRLGWDALASLDLMVSSEVVLKIPVGLGLVIIIQVSTVIGITIAMNNK